MGELQRLTDQIRRTTPVEGLTAVNHALHGIALLGAIITGRSSGDRAAALRLDLGHEMSADPSIIPHENRPWALWPGISESAGFWRQYELPTDVDIWEFQNALAGMNRDPDGAVDLVRLWADLQGIVSRHDIPAPPPGTNWQPTEPRNGNSLQDLMLTAMGWHFAALIEGGAFADRNQCADWLERNLGE